MHGYVVPKSPLFFFNATFSFNLQPSGLMFSYHFMPHPVRVAYPDPLVPVSACVKIFFGSVSPHSQRSLLHLLGFDYFIFCSSLVFPSFIVAPSVVSHVAQAVLMFLCSEKFSFMEASLEYESHFLNCFPGPNYPYLHFYSSSLQYKL